MGSNKMNRTCCICGQPYHFCPVCNSEDAGKPTWYFVFCSENCKNIYNVCTDWRDGNISKEKASEKIAKLNIDGLENFADATKYQIKELLETKKEETTISSTKKTVSTQNKNAKNK